MHRTDVSPLADLPASQSRDLQFAAAGAAFGQKLRGGDYLGQFGYDAIARLAAGARGDDPGGYRGEFVSLVKLADSVALAAAGHKVAPDGAAEGPQVRR